MATKKAQKHKYQIDIKVGRPENAYAFQDGVLSDPVHITEQKTEVSSKTGHPQLVIQTEVETEEGMAAGRTFWIDLPVPNADAEDHENAAYIQKSGENWLKFLRAVLPGTFSVFAEVDKSDDRKWVYKDANGKPMDFTARKKKAIEVSDAALDAAQACWDGAQDFTGSKMRIYPNAGNTGKLFFNFVPVDALADSE